MNSLSGSSPEHLNSNQTSEVKYQSEGNTSDHWDNDWTSNTSSLPGQEQDNRLSPFTPIDSVTDMCLSLVWLKVEL